MPSKKKNNEKQGTASTVNIFGDSSDNSAVIAEVQSVLTGVLYSLFPNSSTGVFIGSIIGCAIGLYLDSESTTTMTTAARDVINRVIAAPRSERPRILRDYLREVGLFVPESILNGLERNDFVQSIIDIRRYLY